MFGYLQGLLKRDRSKKPFTMGDLSSRVGIPADLVIGKERCIYEGVEDVLINANSKCTLELCEEEQLDFGTRSAYCFRI